MTPREKYTPELENLEIELLLQAIHQLHGLDLQEYSAAPIRRRIWEAIKREKVRTVSGLQEKLLHEPHALEAFIKTVLPPLLPFNPEFLARIRYDIVPLLRTYPFVRIWITGSPYIFETYALAIILMEEGLFEKSTIYVTDVNERFIQQSFEGFFPLSDLGRYENLYEKSGGRASFASYSFQDGDSCIFDSSLRRNIVFSRHNLATDGSFNEFNLVLCRTPLKYYNRPTQAKAHQVIYDSLVLFGILGLTAGESLVTSPVASSYTPLDPQHNLYRKVRL